MKKGKPGWWILHNWEHIKNEYLWKLDFEPTKIEYFSEARQYTIQINVKNVRRIWKNYINFLLLNCREHDFLIWYCLSLPCIFLYTMTSRLRFLILLNKQINKQQNIALKYKKQNKKTQLFPEEIYFYLVLLQITKILRSYGFLIMWIFSP